MEEVVKENNRKEFYQDIKEFLNSKYAMLLVSILVVIGWALEFPYVTMFLLLVYEILVFVFCQDSPKAFLLPVISIPYMITTIKYGAMSWIILSIYIAVFFVSMGIYIILQIVKYGKKVKKGNMFYFFLVAMLGNLLGGIIGHFEFVAFVFVFFISLAVYFAYWFCLNFLDDAKKYFANVLMFLAIIISSEVIIEYLSFEDLLYAFENKVVFVGSGEINAAVLFITLGICGCFYLARDSKFDYLYILLAFLFDIIIFLTHSRIALFLGSLIWLVGFFLVAHKSRNKKYLYIGLGVLALIAVVLFAIFFDQVYNLISYYLELGFTSNGRDSLWPWCWEKFKSSPIFGIGFVTPEFVPTLKNASIMGLNIVYAHNFVLHFLTCTGIIGLILNLPFYVKKYIEVFKNFNSFKLFAISVYVVSIVDGFFDPTPNMDPFFVVLSAILIALIERDNYSKTENTNLLTTSDNKNGEDNEYTNDLKTESALNKNLNSAVNVNIQITSTNETHSDSVSQPVLDDKTRREGDPQLASLDETHTSDASQTTPLNATKKNN